MSKLLHTLNTGISSSLMVIAPMLGPKLHVRLTRRAGSWRWLLNGFYRVSLVLPPSSVGERIWGNAKETCNRFGLWYCTEYQLPTKNARPCISEVILRLQTNQAKLGVFIEDRVAHVHIMADDESSRLLLVELML